MHTCPQHSGSTATQLSLSVPWHLPQHMSAYHHSLVASTAADSAFTGICLQVLQVPPAVNALPAAAQYQLPVPSPQRQVANEGSKGPAAAAGIVNDPDGVEVRAVAQGIGPLGVWLTTYALVRQQVGQTCAFLHACQGKAAACFRHPGMHCWPCHAAEQTGHMPFHAHRLGMHSSITDQGLVAHCSRSQYVQQRPHIRQQPTSSRTITNVQHRQLQPAGHSC
jgi:hypothetical protein